MKRQHEFDAFGHANDASGSPVLSRRSVLATGTAVAGAAAAAALVPFAPAAWAQSVPAGREGQIRFERIPTQFIAALGDPDATSGGNAHLWGLWPVDPGPRGVSLDRYESLKATGTAPAGWRFDGADWWLEEHGLIMEQPEFPLPPRQYMVTGNRDARSVLTVHPMDAKGAQRWELSDGATIYDVTHLRCRSARYTPASENSCSPSQASQAWFPVAPGAEMPPVEGCNKQDYAVLIVLGVAVEGA